MKADRQEPRVIFDEVAELYDAVRPGYPDELLDDLIELGGVTPPDLCLEIGCGTGQLTVPLARRGLRIVCVELGANLAALARRNLAELSDVTVETASFETWDPAGRRFAMVVASTAWHWLDPEVCYIKADELLDDEGSLAIITTHHVLPDGGDPFFREIQDAYEAIGEGDESGGPPRPEDVHDLSEEICVSGTLPMSRCGDTSGNGSTQPTSISPSSIPTPGIERLSRPKREHLDAEIHRRLAARQDGRATKHYLNVLHVARSTPSA